MKLQSVVCFLLLCQTYSSYAQLSGCTDPLALNYNANAVVNDGSCFYASVNISPIQSFTLNDNLIETSGLIYWNNRLWSQNDDTDTKLYAIDTATGNQLQVVNMPNVVNTDWEEISQDDDYLYIGDFGNNAHGNRSDLHILRIKKSSILQGVPQIDTIWFNFSNQTNLQDHPGNTTEFDCEAMVVTSDSIYLFKKQWTTFKSTVYRLPKAPGNYTADSLFTLDVSGLITGATYVTAKKLIVLCGYTSAKIPFLYLMYDFPNHQFLLGNKRRININLSFHQVEGIATNNGLKYYITNEKAGNSVVTFPQQLHILDLTNYLSTYFLGINSSTLSNTTPLQIQYNQQTLIIRNSERHSGNVLLCDVSGRLVREIEIIGNSYQTIENIKLSNGIYFIYSSTINVCQMILVTDTY